MPKSDAEILAEARDRARKAGRCIVCRKRKARSSKSTCKPCSEAAAERVKRSRQTQ